MDMLEGLFFESDIAQCIGNLALRGRDDRTLAPQVALMLEILLK